MQRKLILTGDGSGSIEIPGLHVTYHSIYGAIQESKHVFIEAGLRKVNPPAGAGRINIFEMGFGTGLNALLTLIESNNTNSQIYYETVELFPITQEEAKALNYCEQLQQNDLRQTFEKLHDCAWEKEITITPNFIFKKIKNSLLNIQPAGTFRLIFFDAFDPNAQPELWTNEIFKKMFSILEPGGMLVTYCSKGAVRRAMQAVGFIVEKIPGPPKKREMIRARIAV